MGRERILTEVFQFRLSKEQRGHLSKQENAGEFLRSAIHDDMENEFYYTKLTK